MKCLVYYEYLMFESGVGLVGSGAPKLFRLIMMLEFGIDLVGYGAPLYS